MGLAGWSDAIELPVELPDRRSSWHLYPIRLVLERFDIDRGAFIEAMKAAGITCSVHWMPLHLHPYYRERYGYRAEDFPVAASEWPRLVSLPIFPAMSDTEIDHVCRTVGALVEAHARAPRRAVMP